MTRVFLLGAGFSKCAGLPLNKEMPYLIAETAFTEGRQYAGIEIDANTSPAEVACAASGELCLAGLYLKQVALRASSVDFDTFLKCCVSWPSNLDPEWDALVNRGCITISGIRDAVDDAMRAILERRVGPYDYIDALVSYCNRTGSPIYTTNFDSLIEESCVRLRLQPNVAAAINRESALPLAGFVLHKINGSIDWDHIPVVKDVPLGDFPIRHERAVSTRGAQKIALTPTEKLGTLATALPSLVKLHADFRLYKKLVSIGHSFEDNHIKAALYSCMLIEGHTLECIEPSSQLPLGIRYLADTLNKGSPSAPRVVHLKEVASRYCGGKFG